MPDINGLEKKAEQGDVLACLEIMRYYSEGSNGFRQDLEEAKRWAKRAVSAWYRMDWQRIDKNDYYEIHRKAANGDVDCCLQMASFYGTGTNQLAQSATSSREWLEDAIVIYARNAAKGYYNEGLGNPNPEETEEYCSDDEDYDSNEEPSDDDSSSYSVSFDKNEFLSNWYNSVINFEP